MKKTTILAMLVSLFTSYAIAETTLSWEYPGGEWNYVGGQHGQTVFADLNNDGYLDLFSSQNNNTMILGQTYGNEWWSKIIKAGDGIDQTSEILNYRNGSWGFIDYNNDGYLDFILTAVPSDDIGNKSRATLFVYKNNGNETFTKDEVNTQAMAEAAIFNPTDENMGRNHFAIADFNNDGWTDVIVNGTPANGDRYLGLFINNNGTFEKSDALTREVNGNTIWTADFDNDGNMDFVVSGYSVNTHGTWVYYGNGDGTFEEQSLLYGFERGSVIAMDVDNDGMQDILVGGEGYIVSLDKWVYGIAYYRNNGDRTYTETFNPIGIDGWYRYGGKMQPADMNNDGLMDFVFHTSWGDNNTDPKNAISKIVLNNGDGTFTPELGGKYYTVCQGGFDAFDYNQDGIMDIYVYGWDYHKNSGGDWACALMKNATGLTAYTVPVMPENGICEQVNDDVVLTWKAATDAITGDKGIRYNVYAKNKTTGEISMVAPANIETGALKVINHGSFLTSTSYTFKGMNVEDYEFGVQAINNGYVASAFVPCEIFEPEFIPTWVYPELDLGKYEWIQFGSSQMGDINNDGNLDLLLCYGEKTELIENSNKLFNNKIIDGLDNLKAGFGQWIDYNNDGYLDFIIVACTDKEDAYSTSTVALYKNVNGTSFIKDEGNSTVLAAANVYVPNSDKDDQELQPYRIACGDFNNDGWTDVVISGQPAKGYTHYRLTKLFWNNQGTFAADESGVIEQVNNNGASVADFDNDGHMDFVVGGYADAARKDVTDVYFSNGDKTFTQLRLDGCEGGNLLVTDVNNDGCQDILVSGYGAFDGIGLYLNNGDRTFTFKSNSEIGLGKDDWGWASCRVYMVAGDLNNDGFNDIVAHASWDGTQKYTHILLNNGDCTFTKDDSHRNISVRDGGVSIFDYNHDGRLDVHVYGYGEVAEDNPNGLNNGWFNNIMENTTKTYIYTAPTMGNAYYEQVDNDVKLTWDAAIDGITGENGIRYNVYAKNKTTGEIATVAPANIETGYLKATNHGSFLNNTTYTFKGIVAEEYEFGVQAINNGNIASAFTACVLNPYSSVEEVAAETVKVVAQNGIIRIANNGDAADYAVYAINGMQVAAGNAAANAVVTLNVDKGIYIVKVGAQAFKVIL